MTVFPQLDPGGLVTAIADYRILSSCVGTGSQLFTIPPLQVDNVDL